MAYSFEPTSADLETAGYILRSLAFLPAGTTVTDLKTLCSYFQEVAGFVGETSLFSGAWLSWWYFVGSLICFLGFYNAMAVNAERTMMYFCEERYVVDVYYFCAGQQTQLERR